VRRFLIAAIAVASLVGILYLVLRKTDLVLDFAGASLPTLGLVLYVFLDHLWGVHPDDKHWPRLARSLKFWHWTWKGVGLDTKKRQLAAGLILIVLLTGIAQFAKAIRDTREAASTKGQLASANFTASQSLTAATNSQNDIRILQQNLVSKMEGDGEVFLAIATNCPAPPIFSAVAAQLTRPLVVAGASSKVRAWADEAMQLSHQGQIAEAAAAVAAAESRRRYLEAFQQSYSLYQYSIQFLLDSLITDVAQNGDSVTSTCTRLPSVESIIASNFDCRITTISVGSPPSLVYNCDVVPGNSGGPPHLFIRCQLTNELVEAWVQRWEDAKVRSGFITLHSGNNWHEVPWQDHEGLIATNIHRLIGYTAKQSGYLAKRP